MKPNCSNRRSWAFTLVEVAVVIFMLALLVAMLLPAFAPHHSIKQTKINCVNNLKQIGLAYRLWDDDNGGKYPMDVSVTNGGTMELFQTGSTFQNLAFLNYLPMANQLSTPKFLHCPADTNGFAATNSWRELNNQNVSYFVGLDASAENPRTILSGDDNFEINGVAVKSGLLELSTNAPIAWTAARHKFSGNILLADGSVQSVTISGLTNLVQQTGLATNRLAIP
jgi:prepilin-type processing-associated H-X9-DG protein